MAANGSNIATFGTVHLPLLFPGMKTSHTFLRAEVPRPILGADFFAKAGLLIDLRGRRLVRPPRGRTSTVVVNAEQDPTPAICGLHAPRSSRWDTLLDLFPDILVPNFGRPEQAGSWGGACDPY